MDAHSRWQTHVFVEKAATPGSVRRPGEAASPSREGIGEAPVQAPYLGVHPPAATNVCLHRSPAHSSLGLSAFPATFGRSKPLGTSTGVGAGT